VLVDDTGVRATMTASWLLQMGWREVFVLAGAFDSVELERGARPVPVLGLDEARPATLAPGDLHAMLARGEAAVVDLGTSLAYRQGHVPGAWWAVRARLAQGLAKVAAGPLVLTSGDGVLARLAAAEAADAGRHVRVLAGGTEAWRAAGLPLEASAARMADAPDDVWLRPYDRAAGVKAAMQEYLDWEQGLVAQVEKDGTVRFQDVGEDRSDLRKAITSRFASVTRDHVIDAMARVGPDPAKWPPLSRSTRYDVVDPQNGARLPPKLVLSEAVRLATGHELSRREFSGGRLTNSCLETLGFEILRK
jgi:rhodanese-related sulfurtransferase